MEDELFELVKNSPEFDRLPLPSRWFKKYNIPPREAVDTRTFIESGYTLKRQLEEKDLPPIFIDEPQQNGKLVEVPQEDPIKIEVVNRPFDWDSNKRFPDILPSLANADGEPSLAVPQLLNHSLCEEQSGSAQADNHDGTCQQ